MADSLRNLFPLHQKRRQKPLVFGGVLFPISSAAGRNGAAGGTEEESILAAAKKSVSKKRGVGHVPPKAQKAAGHSPAAFTSPQPGKPP